MIWRRWYSVLSFLIIKIPIFVWIVFKLERDLNGDEPELRYDDVFPSFFTQIAPILYNQYSLIITEQISVK